MTTTIDREKTRIVAVTPLGKVMANSYMCWLLTPCCGASGKGLMDGDYGYVGCRACYQEVGWEYGDGEDGTPEGIEKFVARCGGHDTKAEKKEGLS